VTVGLHRDFDLQPLRHPADPDDWRPNSIWTLVTEEPANVAVIIEEIGVGDEIPLHRHQIDDEALLYEAGAAEVRVDEETYRAGDIVMGAVN
jgi:quercetin dioxygenase-like cupin family protein